VGGEWLAPEASGGGAEWSPAVVAGAVKHNNIPFHSLNVARFAKFAGVEWWAPEASGECWSRVVGMEAEW